MTFDTPGMREDGSMHRRGWLVLVVVAVIFAVGFWQQHDSGEDSASKDGGISIEALPPQARETLELIDRGGPYPYERDDAVFMNREGLLPGHQRGYWREYTVRTPGESDRGARRLVRGDAGEVYYTDDHYASFTRVERGTG